MSDPFDEDRVVEPLDSWEMFEKLGLRSGEPARDLSESGVMESLCRVMLERAVEDGLVTFFPGARDIPDVEIAGMAGVLWRALERRGLC